MKMTKRNFFLCISIMLVILFIFLFIIVTKEYINRYDVNSSATEIAQNRTKKEAWVQNAKSKDQIKSPNAINQYAVCISGEKLSRIVRQWSKYDKWNLDCYDQLADYHLDPKNVPELLIVDSGLIKRSNIRYLKQWSQAGITIVYSKIPSMAMIEENTDLQELLGIKGISAKEQELTGIKLFGDFLLGGETHYIANNKEEEKKQDMQLQVPWFLLESGAKTYMVGMLEDESVKNEELPPIIWRYSTLEATAFVVNGDYMEDETGLGLLDAMLYEDHAYTIYPVVNTQNLTVSDFPLLASENNQEMINIYSRTQKQVFRDIVWPGLVAVNDNSQLKLTCMLGTELDDSDTNQPSTDELEYYMKLMKEQRGELGISLNRVTNSGIAKRLQESNELLEKKDTYQHTALYVKHADIENEDELNSFADLLNQNAITKNIRTITTDLEWQGDVLGFLTENITVQATTIDGVSHTYREDFRVRSLETSLAYSNILLEAERIIWPKEALERWENMYDVFSRYTNTYWKPYSKFDRTTLSESDQRVRDFLCIDYEEYRKDDKIYINISNFNEEAWFLLRTHGEVLVELEGGDYTKVEENAYLIQAKEAKVVLKLEDKVKPYITR